MYEPLKILEVYKPITNKEVSDVMEGRYTVSNYGKVFDIFRNTHMTLSVRPDGYLQVSLATNINRKRKSVLVHRLVALLFVKGDTSLIVNHKDGNKQNPFFMNLEWVSYSENNNHAFAKGLMKKGEDTSLSVLTNEQVELICKHLDEQKLSYSEIAKACNINSPDVSSLISSIRKGIVWRHISYKYNFAKDNYSTSRYRILK